MNETRKNGKKTVSRQILAHLALRRTTNFFKKNRALSVTRYHSQLSLCTIPKKANDPILRKLSDGRTDRRTDGQTDGQTDESDFIKHCPTNVKRPTTMITTTII